jgi:hypothetical protein
LGLKALYTLRSVPFKKQDFLTIKTRLLSRANKASFKSKEALFSIRIHWHTSAFILRCQRINKKNGVPSLARRFIIKSYCQTRN